MAYPHAALSVIAKLNVRGPLQNVSNPAIALPPRPTVVISASKAVAVWPPQTVAPLSSLMPLALLSLIVIFSASTATVPSTSQTVVLLPHQLDQRRAQNSLYRFYHAKRG